MVRTGSVTCAVIGLALGAAGAWLFLTRVGSSLIGLPCDQEFPLTSRTLDCGQYDESADSMKQIDRMLDDAVKRYTAAGKAKEVSVWIRDLERKQWAAANETIVYSPASLLKVPVMIAYFKFAEIDAGILQQKITYDAEMPEAIQQDYAPPQHPLVVGQSYTVEDLIHRMIEDSDNVAAALLKSRLEKQFYDETLVDLGINIPINDDTIDYVTVRTVATVYRSLYNASYLNREYSEKALEMLSHSRFKGIAAELPTDVRVAHKFGERTVYGMGSVATHELHDCGIVYKGEHPYTLCIMTSGTNFDSQLQIIEDLSKEIYEAL